MQDDFLRQLKAHLFGHELKDSLEVAIEAKMAHLVVWSLLEVDNH